MKNILLAGVAVGSLFFSSCGDKKADTGIDKTSLKPNEVVETWKNDLVDGRLASLWDSLPSSYQSDLSGIVHSFGEKMDAEVYDEAMKTASSATALLKSKKSVILEMMKETAPADKFELIEGNFDAALGLIDAIVNSDAKSVDGLKKLDVVKFLGDMQSHTKELSKLGSMAGDEYEKVKKMSVSLLSESGDNAEVEMTVDDKKEKMKLVKMQDRWIPEEMSSGWSEMMKEAQQGLDEVGKMSDNDKKQALAGLKMVQDQIKKLEGVNSKEDLMQQMGGLMQMFGRF